MARSVSDAHDQLTASETKHRALFENLRDAVVIVESQGRVVEYHDSETGLLGVEGSAPLGRHLLEVWPEWQGAVTDWQKLIKAVIDDGRRFRAVDVPLGHGGTTGQHPVVDLVVFRVEYSQSRYGLVILRDVTDRFALQTRLRRAETMEAVGTLAGGMAHDFNNLLSGAIGTLSSMQRQLSQPHQAEQITKNPGGMLSHDAAKGQHVLS